MAERRREGASWGVRRMLDRFAGAGHRRAKGNVGEDAACAFLAARGYAVVARNWRSRYGELDIVAVQGEYLCFVEVKARGDDGFGRPEESVTRAKRRQIVRMAQAYLKAHGGFDRPCRFDVVALTGSDTGAWEIELIPNAFDAAG